MDGANIGQIIGIVGIIVVAAIYYAVRHHKQNTYAGRATATVTHVGHNFTLKPYQVRVDFDYKVDGLRYEGFTIYTQDKAPEVGDTLEIQYKTSEPGKYFL